MRFTRQAFAEWLELKADNRSVGDPENTTNCALCKFIKANGVRTVEMQYVTRNLFNGQGYVANPKWMQEYQRRAVKIANWTGVKNITAGTARKILENV